MVSVLVAAGSTSVNVNASVREAAKVSVGGTTVKVCATLKGAVELPTAGCDAVMVVMPIPTKCRLPFTMVATAGLLLV